MRMSRGWWQRNAGRFLWFLDSSNSRLHSVGDPATKKCPVPHKLGCHFFGNAESRISQGLQRRWGESRNVKEKLWDLSRENVYFASNYWCDYFAASESCVCVKKFHLFHGFLSPKFFLENVGIWQKYGNSFSLVGGNPLWSARSSWTWPGQLFARWSIVFLSSVVVRA